MSNRIKSNDIQIGSNYVLPIEQSNVTVQQAKVKKIIAETDAKAQQIIDGAENKSQVIVQTANTEAARIIEAARQKAQEEYDAIKNQAYQEGFTQGEQDGLAKFQNDAQQALESLDTMSSSVFDMKKNIIDSATLDIVELVSAIADKVCHVRFDAEVLEKITLDAIKQLNEKENITIIVNPELVENISSLVPTFKEEIPKLESIRIVEDNSVSPDGVIVETLNTRLDSRVSSQIEEIAQKMLTGADDELE
ncbi:MAG: FliH/SctL family protein [Candidatus Gastranaerophilales bacterium]|nr:FliH/SctL family protein [Candidatus Gastranaerophilales bacterium]MCM1072983.1 FliH/SctL family protein [Bacteroides sp.]